MHSFDKKRSQPTSKAASLIQEKARSPRFIEDNRSTFPVQLKPAGNNTGLPDQLKSGIEALSGMDMSDIRVHRNSKKPAHLNALAYAQGNNIHLAHGQEKHLPHEAWHVVQQRQGRVKPTVQLAGNRINDDSGLENEADMMGGMALQSNFAVQKCSISKGIYSSVVQRFPAHNQIVTATGVITEHELLQILDHVVTTEIANIHLRPATDWFRQFQGLGDPNPYTFPAPSPGLSYNHPAITHRFTVGGADLVRQGTNNYIHAYSNPTAHDHTSYPELSRSLTRLGGAAEVLRAQRMRAMLSAGVNLHAPGAVPAPGGIPGQNVHEAVATTALFGAETARAPRTFLSHMMVLDRLEAQQPYGAGKLLQLPTILNPDKLGAESNNAHWTRKLNSLDVRAAGRRHTIIDGAGNTLALAARRGPAPHGGKAPMAGFGTRDMGQAPIPAVGNINIVQAKEVNVLIKWLELQLGAGAFAAMSKAQALAAIQRLVEERARNYYLMTQAENQARMMRAIIMQQALHGLLRPRPGAMMPAIPVLRIPRALYIQQVMMPMLDRLPVQVAPSMEQALVLRGGQGIVHHGAQGLSLANAMIDFQRITGVRFQGNGLNDLLRQDPHQLHRAFVRASARMHPDRRGGNHEQFVNLQQIYEAIQNAMHNQQNGGGRLARIGDSHNHLTASDVEQEEFTEAQTQLATIARLAGQDLGFVLSPDSPIHEQLNTHWRTITRLYRSAALLHHPDHQQGAASAQNMVELNQAYEVLKQIKDRERVGEHVAQEGNELEGRPLAITQ